MQYSTALSDGILALACLLCLAQLGKLYKGSSAGERPQLVCLLLGFALPAAAAAAGAMRYGLSSELAGLHDWLSRAASFLGLPLLGLAALCLGRNWQWSGPAWGRLLLGLCAFFELFRQMQLLDQYRLFLQMGSLLLIAYAGLLQWPQRLPLLLGMAVAGLFAGAGLGVGVEGWIGPLRRIDLFHGLLALAYPLLAWLLLILAGKPAAKPL
jgi:hypothetical protein